MNPHCFSLTLVIVISVLHQFECHSSFLSFHCVESPVDCLAQPMRRTQQQHGRRLFSAHQLLVCPEDVDVQFDPAATVEGAAGLPSTSQRCQAALRAARPIMVGLRVDLA